MTYKNKYNNNLILKGYCDSDYANCFDSRRFIIGYIFTLGNNIISWNSSF